MAKLRRRYLIRLTIGVLLVIGALTGTYWWCYKLAPMRHLSDGEWLATHSEEARWEEERKDYERTGNSPDLCFRGDRIGYYGDKNWFLWLDGRIRDPDGFRVCGCTEYALALMTNCHVPSWQEWTDANRHKSQEEWIRDGFVRYGVTLHLPPDPADTAPLLKLLNRKTKDFLSAGPPDKDDVDVVPSYLRYNAYRWLRDTGFDPIKYSSENAVEAAEPDVAAGMLHYARCDRRFSRGSGLGRLAFAQRDEYLPMYIENSRLLWIDAGVYALSGLGFAGGVFLIIRTARGASGKAAAG